MAETTTRRDHLAAIRTLLAGLQTGETRSYAYAPGEGRVAAHALNQAAHDLFGVGMYRSRREPGQIVIERLARPREDYRRGASPSYRVPVEIEWAAITAAYRDWLGERT